MNVYDSSGFCVGYPGRHEAVPGEPTCRNLKWSSLPCSDTSARPHYVSPWLHTCSGLAGRDGCEGLAVAHLSVRGAVADSSAVHVAHSSAIGVERIAAETCWCVERKTERVPTVDGCFFSHRLIGIPHIPIWGLGGVAAGLSFTTAASRGCVARKQRSRNHPVRQPRPHPSTASLASLRGAVASQRITPFSRQIGARC